MQGWYQQCSGGGGEAAVRGNTSRLLRGPMPPRVYSVISGKKGKKLSLPMAMLRMSFTFYTIGVSVMTQAQHYFTLTQADDLLGLTPLGAALKRPRHTLHTHYIRGVDECTAPGPSGFSVTSCVGPTHTPPAPSAHTPPPTPLAPVSPNQLELASAARA